jgi:hypothetical protein
MTGGNDGELCLVEVEAKTHHGGRLQRLVAGAWEDGLVDGAYGECDVTSCALRKYDAAVHGFHEAGSDDLCDDRR